MILGTFKPRFRPTLLFILLGLMVVSISVVGATSYVHARRTAQDLADQILHQAAQRTEEQIQVLLRHAANEGELVRRLSLAGIISSTGVITAAEFPAITAYFYEVMRVYPQLSFLSLGLEQTGEYCHVERRAGGKLVQQECILAPTQDRIQRRDYELRADGRREQTRFDDDWKYDPRTRPYYQACQAAARQVWTETYVFTNDPAPDVPGVTCATPLRRADGSWVGVVSSDFNLEAMCAFLQTLQIGREGFAVVIERFGDNQLRVIAHPRPELLIKVRGQVHELMPAEELPDGRLRGLVAELRPRTNESSIRLNFHHNDRDYLAEYRRLSGHGMPNWWICTVIPETEIMAGVWRSNQLMLVFGLVALIAGTLVSVIVSAQVARPLEQLACEAEAIGRLDLESKSVIASRVREVDRLAVATEDMKTGLRSFRKYVPADLVRSLIGSGQEARLGAERRVVTVVFSDIVGFTTLAETLDPDALTERLGEYLGIVSDQIHQTGGTIDKYTGDGVMAMWGAPQPNPQHALDACRAVIRSRDALRPHEARLGFHTRYGIHTGEAAVGNFGSAARLNYTVMGDTVNLASRLEGLNKHYGTEIIISASTFQSAQPGIVARPLDWVAVKGKTGSALVYELTGLTGEVDAIDPAYTEALQSYGRQDWARAMELLEQVLQAHPLDQPAALLLARCRVHQANPPGPDWDKTHRLETK